MSEEGSHFRFGRFSLDANDRMLLCDGRRVPLPPKVLQTLLILVRHGGRVVEKTFLMEAVWPDNVVEEANLAQHIFTLRRVLGDSADEPRFIETVPGRGYRFVASIDSNQKSVQRSVAVDRNGFNLKQQQHADLDAAYRHYLRGRFFWSKCSKESLEKSLDCFHQALALAPEYAAAYAGLADSYFRLSTSYWPPKEAYPKAMAAVLKALELDKTLAEAHAVLGIIKTRCDWDWIAARQAFERAIEINPLLDDGKGSGSAGQDLQGCLGRAYALAGLRDKAEEIINSLKAQSARRYVSAYVLALVTEALASVDDTFAWLEKAYADHDEFLCWLKVDPRLKSLRNDARYFDLVNRVFALQS